MFIRLFVYLFVPSSLEGQISASKLKSQLQGLNPSLEAQFPTLRLKSQLLRLNPSHEAQVLAWRLKSQPGDTNPSLNAKFQPTGQIPDSRPERTDFRPERVNFRPERADFRSERAWGDERTDGRTDRMTNESRPVFYRTSSPFEAAAQKEKL